MARWARIAVAAVLTLGVGACEEGPGLPVSFGSGERLVARVSRGDDGSRFFLAWHDRERGEDCAFARADDGRWRCLPIDAAPIEADTFTDADCTQRLYGAAALGPPPWVSERVLDETCQGRTTVYRTGAKRQVAAVYHKAIDGRCELTQDWPLTYWEPAERVDASRYQEGERRAVGAGPLRRVIDLGGDGAWRAVALAEAATGRELEVDESWRGPALVSPTAEVVEGFYADQACRVEVARGETCGPAATQAWARGWLGDDRHVRVVVREAETVYRRVGGDGCVPVAQLEPGRYYEVRWAVPGEVLVPAVTDAGGVRLRQPHAAASDGTPGAPFGPIVDAWTGYHCQPFMATDGVERCLPYEGVGSLSFPSWVYADPECREPVAVDSDGELLYPGPTTPDLVLEWEDFRFRVLELEAPEPVTSLLYELTDAGRCEWDLFWARFDPGDLQLRRIRRERPPGDFVRVWEEVEGPARAD